jgi:hypothetical protein
MTGLQVHSNVLSGPIPDMVKSPVTPSEIRGFGFWNHSIRNVELAYLDFTLVERLGRRDLRRG